MILMMIVYCLPVYLIHSSFTRKNIQLYFSISFDFFVPVERATAICGSLFSWQLVDTGCLQVDNMAAVGLDMVVVLAVLVV